MKKKTRMLRDPVLEDVVGGCGIIQMDLIEGRAPVTSNGEGTEIGEDLCPEKPIFGGGPGF